MTRIFGLDIGTASVGFAVIDHDADAGTGEILRLGVQVFPESHDPQGTPLNQERRQARRRHLDTVLFQAGLLPPRHSPE